MDAVVQITIGKNTFKPAFGLKVFRELGRHWKKETLNEVIQELQVLENLTDGTIPLKVLDIIYDLLFYSFNSNPANRKLVGMNELEDLPFDKLIEIVTQVAAAMGESMPQQPVEEEKK